MAVAMHLFFRPYRSSKTYPRCVKSCKHTRYAANDKCGYGSKATYCAAFESRDVLLHLEEDDMGDVVDAGRGGGHCAGRWSLL